MSTSEWEQQLEPVADRLAEVSGGPLISNTMLTTTAKSIEVELSAVYRRRVLFDVEWRQTHTGDELAAALMRDYAIGLSTAAAQIAGLGLVRPQTWEQRGRGLIVAPGPMLSSAPIPEADRV